MSQTAMILILLLSVLSCFADDRLHCTGDCQRADPAAKMSKTMMHKEHFWTKCVDENKCPNKKVVNTQAAQCVNGFAGEYPCCNVDLLAFVDIKSLGAGGDGNDIWGWTDPVTGHEIAIAAMFDGTSFVDVTNPTQPSVLGFLPTHTTGTFWRDVKVFANHAYIVSEAYGHGLQVFDLTTLRDAPRNHIFSGNVSAVPQLKETVWYGEFGSAHNLVINEESGYLYSVGSKTCNSGLHIVDIRSPQDPKFVGCYAEDGYVHDAQCVNYDGPDKIHFGKEICFCYDEDTLTIVDVTNKARPPKTISRTPYLLSQYTHQGWLLPGSRYLLLDDELDELLGPYPNTRTMLWDIQNLAAPTLVRSFCSSETVIDHNLYTLGNKAYQANYCGGLRILDTAAAQAGGELREIGFFDVAPDCSTTEFLGSWSVYPYFKSGTIVVNSIDRGLFVLAENGNKQCETKPAPRCS